MGGAVQKYIKWKEVGDKVKVYAEARADGKIKISLEAGVGNFVPTGQLQIPSPIKRDTENSGVTLKQGQTLYVAGFIDKKGSGIERKDPLWKIFPLIGKPLYNFFKGEEKEESMDMILFLFEPNYIDIDEIE